MLGSVKLEVGADYNSLWGKTKEVRTFDDDYDGAFQMAILMISFENDESRGSQKFI